MSTRLPKMNSDINAWHTLNNLFNVNNIGNEFITIALNSNNPPTIKRYTRALFYATDASYTIAASPATGNNEYGAGDNITYLTSEAIYEDTADLTFTWSSTVRGESIPAQSDGTWYILLTGSVDTDETTIGQGTYNFSKTETPTWNDTKGGWYSSGGYKVLGSFDSTSGTVSGLTILRDRTNEKGYIQIENIVDNSGDITVKGLICDVDGHIIDCQDDIEVVTSLAASTWYAMTVSEVTGVVSYSAISAFDNWTISGNQLNAYSIYNSTYKYCRDSISSVWYRIIGVMKSNSTPDGFDYIIPIKNIPKSYVEASSNAGNTINNVTLTIIDYEDIEIDINSEITTGAAWKFTAVRSSIYNYSTSISLASNAGWELAEYLQLRNYKSGSYDKMLNIWYSLGSQTISVALSGSGIISLQDGGYLDIQAYQNSDGNIALSTSSELVWIRIVEA